MNLKRIVDHNNRISEALPVGKSHLLHRVIVERMVIREIMRERKDAWTKWRQADRLLKITKQSGVAFPEFERYRAELAAHLENINMTLIRHGLLLLAHLDAWKLAGATFDDLCNLCCIRPEQGRRIVGKEAVWEPFSNLIFIHHLDYKEKDCVIHDEVDAPLTHALTATMLHFMLHTERGKTASEAAIQEAFPNLRQNRLYKAEDDMGNTILVDKDGETVARFVDDEK